MDEFLHGPCMSQPLFGTESNPQYRAHKVQKANSRYSEVSNLSRSLLARDLQSSATAVYPWPASLNTLVVPSSLFAPLLVQPYCIGKCLHQRWSLDLDMVTIYYILSIMILIVYQPHCDMEITTNPCVATSHLPVALCCEFQK